MVTPPESPEEEEVPNHRCISLHEDQEIFHTPPESRSTSTSFDNCNDDRMIGCGFDPEGGGGTEIVDADDADSGRAVDLGRDTDLGFSEVEVDPSQRIQANLSPDGTFRRESEEIRVSKRGVSPKEQLSAESPSKRLKSSDFELPTEPLGTPKVRNTNELLKSLNKWNLKKVGLSPGATEELELGNQQNHESNGEVGEGSVRKRRLDFSSEIVGSGTEERNIGLENNNGETSNRGKGLNFSTEDIEGDAEEKTIERDRVRYSGEKDSNPCEMEKKSEGKRALPSWAKIGRVKADGSVDEELEDNETELSSRCNETGEEDNERADEELEVNEMELPSCANGRVGSNEKADEEPNVNETETIHLDANSDNLNEDVEKVPLLDVLMKLEKDSEKDGHLQCLTLLEVAQRKWGCIFLG
ncbi:hypothetical protein PTKIN_Ptkin04bG0217000 [Pterospermum kingtungense]